MAIEEATRRKVSLGAQTKVVHSPERCLEESIASTYYIVLVTVITCCDYLSLIVHLIAALLTTTCCYQYLTILANKQLEVGL